MGRRTEAQKKSDKKYVNSEKGKRKIREYLKKSVDDRVSRNKARREMVKKYGKKRLRGKDIDHKDSNPRNNSKGNLSISDRSRNRAKNK